MNRLLATRHRIYRRIEAMQIEIALMRIGLAFRAFHPNQPRVPAGHPDGGQWISGDGSHVTISDDEARLIFVSDNDDDRYKVDLRMEEGRGGHTVGRHIGKSDDDLFERVSKSQWRTLLGHGGLTGAGSFDSIESANNLVNRTIDANREFVDLVASGQLPRKFIEKTFDNKTGREAHCTNDQVIYLRDAYSVGVELRHDPSSPRGFRIRSAYPSTKGD